MRLKGLVAAVSLVTGGSSAFGQQIPALKAGNETIQIHAFASQGFADSNDNNFMTMNTSSGTFGMTGFGINVSSQRELLWAGAYSACAGRAATGEPVLECSVVVFESDFS